MIYQVNVRGILRPLGYERVYLPLKKVADTPFHIQGRLIASGGLYYFLITITRALTLTISPAIN